MNKEPTGIVRYTVEQLVNGLRNRAKLLLDGGNPVTPVDLKYWASCIEQAHKDDVADLRAKMEATQNRVQQLETDIRQELNPGMVTANLPGGDVPQVTLEMTDARVGEMIAEALDIFVDHLKRRGHTTTYFVDSMGHAIERLREKEATEPRPSPEYVRLLEQAYRDGFLSIQGLPNACVYRDCAHLENWPIGCLQALAEAREKKAAT